MWGAVFHVPNDQTDAIHAVERGEGRTAVDVEAIDRLGKRHPVVTHVSDGESANGAEPSVDYVRLMLAGSRHWALPAGWIVGLQEHLGELR